ncbi:hypothetical protein PGT21_009683 [Puccinia graminis f. sp. tritici]|uniref:Uncharacterized protein n=1 Tax=Puccinia graminis f. sp. tritici TaxID=56615 RepID=A0A5B0PTM9_PUCGR|nr:hypothetical protein PGT21_009683 [Puccinia graminis f. sp. tritici]
MTPHQAPNDSHTQLTHSTEHKDPQLDPSTTPNVPPQTAEQLESKILAQIADFSNATQGVTRGQPRGRGRGKSRGARGTRGGTGRGRGAKPVSTNRNTDSAGVGGRGSLSTSNTTHTNLTRGSGTGGGCGANSMSNDPDPVDCSNNGPTLTTLDGLPEMLESPKDEIDPDEPADDHKQHQLEPHIMDELSKLLFDELRGRALKYAKYRRLTAEDCFELGKSYFAYQRQVYLIACKRKLHIKPALSNLGMLNCTRGPTNFNQYCKYDEVASLTYYNHLLDYNERMRLCGLMWGEVDKATKEKWKEPEFVKSKIEANR